MAHVGAGLCSCGAGPYGFGTPATSPSPAGGIYRDEQTGETLTGPGIDPHTRQYKLDANGRILGMRSVPQMVYLALNTVRGSAVLTGLGNELHTIKTIGADHQQLVESVIRDALADLVARKMVEVIRVNVRLFNPTGTLADVEWRDLTTGTIETTPLT